MAANRAVSIGCIKSPFNPQMRPLGITLWTFPTVTVKLHYGKALGRRQGRRFVG